MTLTKDIVAKLVVAIVAVAMVFSAFASTASAQTTEELQQMINDLLAQVAALQAQAGMGDSVAAGVCPYTWTRDLSQGSTGADVMKLQQFLNADPDTQVSMSGAGAPGMETEYYGPATAAAVSKMQVKYRADVLSPANLVNPTGYFGPSSRAKANALCVAPVADDSSDDSMDDAMEDDDEDEDEAELSGEASLDDFEIDDADDDTVEEGEEDVEIAEITIQFSDGDAEISRLDLMLTDEDDTGAGEQANEEDPWKVFESISLWVDGDKIAEEDADSKSDYLGDEDNGVLRFSGLDLVGMEEEDLDIVVAASIQNNLDTEGLGNWDLDADAMRFFDADGVATTEDGAPVTDDTATFTIQTEGSDDEVVVKESSNDPDATTLLLQDDKKETYTAFVFDLDTDDSTNDIQINQIIITSTTTDAATGLAAYVNDAELIVDGDVVPADDVTVGNTSLTFDFDDGDFMIDPGDRPEVEVSLEFDSLDPGEEGDFIQLSLASANVDAEGADDITASGAATGEQHVMITEGIVILADGVETDTNTEGDTDPVGEFTIEFEVTAYENDYYISATSSASYTVEGSTSTPTFTLTSTADEDTTDVFTVNDGSTETFTLKVNVNPVVDGDVRVTLDSVDYSDSATYYNGGAETITTRTLSPASDYRTAYQFIKGT